MALELLAASLAQSAYYLVKADGSGLFPTIQAAVDFATDGDVILLADGVFRGPGNRDVTLSGKDLLVRSESGDRDACIIDVEGTPGVPHRGFLFVNGETAAAGLRSITIRGGYVSGTVWPSGSGGAVLCTEEASPTFVDCVFRSCSARTDGGAISCREASARLIGCVVEDCTASFGGAIFVDRPCLLYDGPESGSPPPLVLESCLFSSNWSGDGGAIYARGVHTRVEMTGCTLRDNGADRGGGLKLHGALGVFQDCLVEGNWAAEEGGGFSIESTIFCRPDPGIHDGEGRDPMAVEISNCAMVGNVAEVCGGAVFVLGYEAALTRCTLAANGSPSGGGLEARAVYADHVPSNVLLENTIIAFGTSGEAVRSDPLSTVQLSCCDLFGNAGGDWVGEIAAQGAENGNMSEDPLFCDFEGGDLGLQQDSPCLGGPGGCGQIGAFPVGCASSSIPADGEPVRFGELLAIAPNPFVDEIVFELRGERPGPARLRLFDPSGRLVAARDLDASSRAHARGVWRPFAEAGGRPSRGSGLYLLQVETPGRKETRKLLCLR